MKLTVILEPEEGGGYSVICPAIPGCVSQGDSLESAIENIKEAIALCLDVRKEDGLGPPVESPASRRHSRFQIIMNCGQARYGR